MQLEIKFLSILKGYRIPEVKSFGRYGNFFVMVQELLGYNLMQLSLYLKGFSIKDIAMIGIQIMDRIEYVHSKGVLHRDIKQENFVIGYNNSSIIYNRFWNIKKISKFSHRKAHKISNNRNNVWYSEICII